MLDRDDAAPLDGGRDGGLDARLPAPDAYVAPDAVTIPVDAAPTACSATAPCARGSYCDYGGGCGGPGAIGTCVAVIYPCSPRGGLVCGCDGNDHLDLCEAHTAGTNVTGETSCPSPPASDRTAVVARACAPAGGPAWTFTVAGTDTACGDGRPGLSITLYADLATVAPRTAFVIDSGHAAGIAQSCPYGLGGACIGVSGTVVVESFDEARGEAAITYGLVGRGGTYDAPIDVRALEQAVRVTAWCGVPPVCS